MATNLKDTTVKYVNKDFESYKRDLMKYAQSHFSGSYQDYNEASPGMMILELQAFIADNLAYYMDQQFLEIKQSTARQLTNIEEFAKMRGYKPKGKRAARVDLYWMIEVPAVNAGGKWVPASPSGGPLTTNQIILRAGSQAGGPAGTVFETLEDLDFGATSQENPQQLQVASWNGNDPKTFAVRRKVTSVAGKTVTDTIPVGDFRPYFRTQLGQSDVLEVIDVVDSDGFNWYEVDFLSQNVIFDQVLNTGSDVGEVPYVMKARSAPRRFIVDTSVATSATFLQFGNGDGLKFDDELVPNIAQLSLPITGRKTFANFILDPQNFLKTRALGLSPYNTTLTVRYRVGGGLQSNVPAQSINKALTADIVFGFPLTGLTAPQLAAVNNVRSSAEVINIDPSVGGGNSETASDIKVNADGYFAAQGRCVTKEDFVAHALTMPARFGRPEKVYTKPSEFNPMGVDLHVLSTDTDGHFSKPSPTLIQNMKTYLNRLRMVTEGITILPAYVVNFAINFGVVISPKFNRAEVLTNCMNTLKTYFKNENMQIGMPIVDSDVRAQLQNVKGVISVYKLEFSLKWGLPYSEDINLDFQSQKANGILYCPQDAIFELRYPDNDITGESK